MPELIYKDESYKIIGACFEVYGEQGCGYGEPIYHESLGIEFRLQSIPAVSKPRQQIAYKGHILEQTFEPDYVCHGKIIVELKAEEKLTDKHRGQVLKYLKATGFQLGLLVNFGHYPGLEYERIANTTGRIAKKSPTDPADPADLHG